MAEDDNSVQTGSKGKLAKSKDEVPFVFQEFERSLVNFIGEDTHEMAKNIFTEFTKMGRDTYQFAVDLISELATELTGVKSLKIVPKGPLEYDVEIARKKELALKLKHTIAPLIELRTVTFAKHLNFGAEVDRAKKGLRMKIREGLSLTFMIPIIGEYVIDIKGGAMLTRNEKNQLLLSTTVTLPGLDSPIDISIPLTWLFAENKKKPA